ncbi:MAG: GNAT family N-acetyltransferase [Alphaproteobacteria bacterium]|nr:GNAT family N-acetyltransferase [Alphaproteobacteria bacterium]
MNFRELPVPALQAAKVDHHSVERFIGGIKNFKVLETPRLIMRVLALSDTPSVHEILGPPEVHKWNYLFRSGFSLEDAHEFVQAYLSGQAQGIALCLLFTDKIKRSVLGEVHAVFDPGILAADIGYSTLADENVRGKGYATEATRAFLQGLCQIGLQHICLTAAPENIASQHVISKLGVPQVEDVSLQVKDVDGCMHARNLYYMGAQEWCAGAQAGLK